jgi:gamma-glutamylcyclotransferase (GGCT)/AIG2-like uncharacterized protein YtfP
MYRVFVYGSLLKGMGNHPLLKDSKCIGTTISPEGFDMIDLGYFPGVLQNDESIGKVIGEVYEVDDDTLRRLDCLEGFDSNNPHNGMYNRITIETELGNAYIYTYNNRHGRISDFVPNGDWRSYYKTKMNAYSL